MSITNQPQFVAEYQYQMGEGERWVHALIASCINVAISDVLTAPLEKNKTFVMGRAVQSAAVTWIFNPPNTDSFNSFESFCTILNIDAGRARKKIYQMLVDKFGQQVAELGIVNYG